MIYIWVERLCFPIIVYCLNRYQIPKAFTVLSNHVLCIEFQSILRHQNSVFIFLVHYIRYMDFFLRNNGIYICVTKFKHPYNFSHEKKDNTYLQVPNFYYFHDDVIKWKHFPRNWPFVRGIHRSRWIPRTKAIDAELWCFLWSEPE